jgi:hypothetical protein
MAKIPIFALWTSSLPFYRKWEIILLTLFVHTPPPVQESRDTNEV